MSSATTDDVVTRLAAMPRSERISHLFDWDLWDYQADIADDPTADVVVTCGRQVGKTETGGAIAADAFVTSTGYDVMIAGKWQETADELFRRAKQHLERGGLDESHADIVRWNRTEIESVTGARLYAKTLKTSGADAGDSQRGKRPRVVIIDESAIVGGEPIEKVIKPMFLTHGDDHELFLLSTPRGKQGFHYEKHANDPGWSSHHVPSSTSPKIDDEYLEEERKSVDDITWRQEYLGEFVDLGEVYITAETYDAVMGDVEAEAGSLEFLFVDVARQGSDRTVYMGADADGVVVPLDAEGLSDIPGIVSRIETLHEVHDFAAVGVDETAVGGGVIDLSSFGLAGVIEPVTFSLKSKSQMYRKLKADLERGALTVPDARSSDADEHAVRMRDETANLQYDYTANGHLKVGHAPGGRDDYADALAGVNWIRGESAGIATGSVSVSDGSDDDSGTGQSIPSAESVISQFHSRR